MARKLNFVRQPPGSNMCGQACVAMLCDISLEEACMLARTKGATRTLHLKRVLHAMGVKHGDRRVLGMPDKNETALLFWKSNDTRECHWTVWHKGKYYDPAAGVFRSPPLHVKNARVTSHLKVEL